MATQLNNTYLASGGTLALGFGTSATRVYGSVDADTVTIAAGVTVVLDGSFNRGNDTIKFTGNAASYSIVRVNASTVLVTDASGTSVTIPVGSAGTKIQFADATRTLSGSSAGIVLGDQAVTSTAAPLAQGTSPAGEFILTSSAPTVTEGSNGTKTLTYLLQLNKAPTSELSLNYQTTDAGTAQAGDDFQVVAGLVTFAAGQTAATVSVTVYGDTTVEADETVVLRVSGSKLVASVDAVGTIVSDDVVPGSATSFTVSAGDIAAANAANVPVAVNVGETGNKTVTIQSDGASATRGIIINGNANAAITSGAAADTIIVSGNGNNTINSGAGNDDISVYGTGTNTINVGAGTDKVLGGSGNDTIVFAAGALQANDIVDGGEGIDTVRVSGEGNVIGAGLTNIENIVFDGTTASISAVALQALIEGGLKSIQGSSATTELTITGLNDLTTSTLDLSKITIVGGLEKVITTGTGTVVLNTAQATQIASVAASTGTLTQQVIVTGAQTVAQAAALIAGKETAKFALVDTADNLARAPSSVFAQAVSVEATTDATAAQAVQIAGVITNSGNTSIFSGTAVDKAIKVNVTDTASMLANNASGLAIADKVTATTTATVAEANAIVGANKFVAGVPLFTASYAVADAAAALKGSSLSSLTVTTNVTAGTERVVAVTTGSTAGLAVGMAVAGTNIPAGATIASITNDTTFVISANATAAGTAIAATVTGTTAAAALNGATSVAITGSVSVADVAAINAQLAAATGGLTKVAADYSLADTAGNLTATSAAAVTSAAKNILVATSAGGGSVAALSVADATAVELLANTGTNTYKLSDTALALRNASSAVTAVGSLNGAALTDSAVTVANYNALIAQYGRAAFTDVSTVTDTAAELVKLSPAALLENDGARLVVSGTATVAELVALNTFFTVASTGARLTTLEPVVSSVNIRDTADNLAAAILDPATRKALDLAGTVAVTGAATVKQIADINGALTGGANTQDEVVAGYTLVDTAANLLAGTSFASVTTNVTSGSERVVTTASTAGLVAGMAISGAGIPTGATIASITNSTTFVISANATAAGTVPATITSTAGQLVSGVLDNAVSVTVSGTATVQQIETIDARFGNTPGGSVDGALGVDIVYALKDTAANLVASGASAETAAATSVTLSSPIVSTTNAGLLTNAANFPAGVTGGFVIEGDVTAIAAATTTLLNKATKVVLVDAIASLFTNGQPVAAVAKATEVIASTEVADAAALALNPDASKVSGFRITDSSITASTGNVAAVNALSALKPTTYAVAGSTFSDLMASGAALGTFVQKAASITVSDAMSVAQFNALDARAAGTIVAPITDTAAALASSTAAAAIAAATVRGTAIAVSTAVAGDNFASVADAIALTARGITGYKIVDTAANISAAGDAVLLAKTSAGVLRATGITISDGGEVTLSVAAALLAFDVGGTSSANDDGSAAATYNLVDTAANLASAAATDKLVAFANNVTATTVATGTEATKLAEAARTPMGTLTYDVAATTKADIVSTDGVATAAANKARNITIDVTAALSVAEAAGLRAATNTGTDSYRISDTADALGGTATTALTSTRIAAIEAATGTVTLSTGTVSAIQATRIAAYTKPVVYDVDGSVASLTATTVSAGALNEARTINASSGTATAAQATKLLAATNSGTTTIAAVSVTAAEAVALTLTSNDAITTLSVTGIATAAQAATIWAKDVGANITTINFVSVTGTASELAAFALNSLQRGILVNSTNVIATTAATAAQAFAIEEANSAAVYDIADTFANLMLNTDVTGAVNRSEAIAQADKVTVTDAISLAQAKQAVDAANPTTKLFELADAYTLVDTDGAILTAMSGADAAVLFKAASVTLANGTSVKVDYIGSALHIVGTRAEIEALPASLATAQKLIEVSVADLVANPTYFTTLAGNVNYRVVDTYANLTSGNILIAQADGITVTDNVSVAQAVIARALITATGEVSYSLKDTATNLLASSAATVLTDSVNVTATTAVTAAQAGTILTAVGLTGTASYSISQSDAVSITSGDNAALKAATDITITATANGSINATEAALLLEAKNSGSTVISQVNGTLLQLQTLLLSKGANDTISKIDVVASDTIVAVTVAELKTLDGLATSAVYSLTDTAANLVAAAGTVLNGATSLTLSGTATAAKATVAQLIVLDAATPPLTAAISDTAANILAASPTLLAAYNTTPIVVSGAISAATAAELNSFENLNRLDISVEAAQLTDTSANLLLIENANVVGAALKVTVSDVMTAARAGLVIAKVNNGGTDLTSADFKFDLSDSYANLALSSATANLATKVTITNTIGAAQAKTADDWAGTAVYDNVRDTATNVANATFAGALAKAKTVTLTTDATVAQAGRISDMANVTSYAIKDEAANVYNALNTTNGLNVADRKSVLGAASVTVTDLVSVVQAVGDPGTNDEGEKRGLGTVPGAVFSVIGSAADIAAALRDPAKAPALLNATTVELTDGSTATVADLTLIADILGSAFLYDVVSATLGTSEYRITDTFANIQNGDATLVAGAKAIVANGTLVGSTEVADTIDMSGFSIGMTINGLGGADTITGTAAADVITGGDDNDIFRVVPGGSTSVAGTSKINATGQDKINDFASGDLIRVTGQLANGFDISTDVLVGTANNTTGANGDILVAGNFAATTYLVARDGVITDGFDTAVVVTSNGTTAAFLDAAEAQAATQFDVTLAAGATVVLGANDDTVVGSSTNDTITGGAGADIINGGAGADTIIGGVGADTLTGGSGIDTFVFEASANGSDKITDFTAGTGGDVLNLDAALAATSGVVNTANGSGVYASPTSAALADQTTSIAVNNKLLIINSGALATTGYDTAAELAALLADGGAFDAVDFAVSKTGFLLIGSNDGTSNLLWQVTNDGTAGITAAELTLVATMTVAVDGIDTYHTNNFVLG